MALFSPMQIADFLMRWLNYQHTLWFLDGVISSALFDRCILRVGFTEAIVDGGEWRAFFSENELTATKVSYM